MTNWLDRFVSQLSDKDRTKETIIIDDRGIMQGGE